MTGKEAAQALRRLAVAVEKYDQVPMPKRDVLDEDCQIGAAAMITFLRDMFTIAGKDNFTREDLLVLLNEIQGDRDIFTMDLMALLEAGGMSGAGCRIS